MTLGQPFIEVTVASGGLKYVDRGRITLGDADLVCRGPLVGGSGAQRPPASPELGAMRTSADARVDYEADVLNGD